MIWAVFLVCFAIMFVMEIYSISKGKPTRKSALKRSVNMLVYLIGGAGLLFSIGIVLALALAGNSILMQSTHANTIVIANGITWMFNIGLSSFLFVMLLEGLNILVRKKKSQVVSIYYNYIDKLDKVGFLKYTEEEKEYNKAQDVKSKEQIRRWFPFIKKFDKKVV
jgi:hypothetical protein